MTCAQRATSPLRPKRNGQRPSVTVNGKDVLPVGSTFYIRYHGTVPSWHTSHKILEGPNPAPTEHNFLRTNQNLSQPTVEDFSNAHTKHHDDKKERMEAPRK